MDLSNEQDLHALIDPILNAVSETTERIQPKFIPFTIFVSTGARVIPVVHSGDVTTLPITAIKARVLAKLTSAEAVVVTGLAQMAIMAVDEAEEVIGKYENGEIKHSDISDAEATFTMTCYVRGTEMAAACTVPLETGEDGRIHGIQREVTVHTNISVHDIMPVVETGSIQNFFDVDSFEEALVVQVLRQDKVKESIMNPAIDAGQMLQTLLETVNEVTDSWGEVPASDMVRH